MSEPNTEQRRVYQPPYANVGFPIPSENLDFTFCRDVVLFYGIRVDETTTVRQVTCNTKNYVKWSVEPTTDTQFFNGFCLYRQDGSSLTLVAQTQNSDSFLCTNISVNDTDAVLRNDNNDPSTDMRIQTFSFVNEVTLEPGTYYLAVSSKQNSDESLSYLDMVAYDTSIRDNIVQYQESYGMVLVYKYIDGVFPSAPPLQVAVDTDMEIVLNNDNGYACLLYLAIE